MNQFLAKKSSTFLTRKVSVDQAIRLLGRNGIRVNKEKAEIILDFLYLIARTYKKKTNTAAAEYQPKESNTNTNDGFKTSGGRIDAAARKISKVDSFK